MNETIIFLCGVIVTISAMSIWQNVQKIRSRRATPEPSKSQEPK